MEKQYKLNDRVSKDSLKSPTFKMWLKRILCAVCIISLALQLTLCCIPMEASAENSIVLRAGSYTWNNSLFVFDGNYVNDEISFSFVGSFIQPYSEDGSVYVINYFNAITFYFYEGASAEGNDIFGVAYVVYKQKGVGGEIDGIEQDLTSNPQTVSFYLGDSFVADFFRNISIDDQDVDLSFGNYFISSSNYSDFNPSNVYDFTGETRIFNPSLTILGGSIMLDGYVDIDFDYQIYRGDRGWRIKVESYGNSNENRRLVYYCNEVIDGVNNPYSFTAYEQKYLQDGTWKVPRARAITFLSNPEDPIVQQWILDNTVLVDLVSLDYGFNYGYSQGYNDGWTNSAIGDTLKAPVEALNNIILLDIAGVTITLGGVIFTMVVLSIMLIFLKKYAGG